MTADDTATCCCEIAPEDIDIDYPSCGGCPIHGSGQHPDDTAPETGAFDAADTVAAPSKPDQSETGADVVQAAAGVLARCFGATKPGRRTRYMARTLQAAHLLADPADRDEPTLESELRSARAEKSDLKDVIDELRAQLDRVRALADRWDSPYSSTQIRYSGELLKQTLDGGSDRG